MITRIQIQIPLVLVFPLIVGSAFMEVSPNKLKQGHGEMVLQILHGLTKFVMMRMNFTYQQPVYPDEGLADETYCKLYGTRQCTCRNTIR